MTNNIADWPESLARLRSDVVSQRKSGSSCGANATGGGGFQPGNDCAKGDSARSPKIIDNPDDGENIAFASPNIDESHYDDIEGTDAEIAKEKKRRRQVEIKESIKKIRGSRQANIKSQFADTYRDIGIDARMSDAIGVWADGAENSVIHTSDGVEHDKWRYALAKQGKLSKQKDVIAFTEEENGPARLFSLTVDSNDIQKISDDAADSGLEYHTIERMKDGSTGVYIFTPDASWVSDESLIDFGRKYNVETIEKRTGQGEFVAQGEEEFRSRATLKYNQVIDDYESRSGDRGRNEGRKKHWNQHGQQGGQREGRRVASQQKSSGCGANAQGGGGFQPGNNCASGESSTATRVGKRNKPTKRGYVETVSDRRIGVETELYQNPTTNDLHRMAMEQRKRERQNAAASAWKIDASKVLPSVRGFLTDDNVYAWDAYTATHPGMAMGSDILMDDDVMFTDDFQSFVAEIGRDGRLTNISPGDFLKNRKKIDEITKVNPIMSEIWDGTHGTHATVKKAVSWPGGRREPAWAESLAKVRKSKEFDGEQGDEESSKPLESLRKRLAGTTNAIENATRHIEHPTATEAREGILGRLSGLDAVAEGATIARKRKSGSSCGANAAGGGGFQSGNTCGSGSLRVGAADGTNDSGPVVDAGSKADPSSKEFNEWFKGSKVVDANGDPLLLHHGSYTNVNELVPSERRRAIYATPSEDGAAVYGDYVYDLYVDVKNPLFVDGEDTHHYDKAGMEKDGHDGIIGFHWVWESEEAQKPHPHFGGPIGKSSYTREVAEGMGRHVDSEGRAWFEVVVPDSSQVRISEVRDTSE